MNAAQKLEAVKTILANNAEIAAWYKDEHGIEASMFTVQSVVTYGLNLGSTHGEIADQILIDGGINE